MFTRNKSQNTLYCTFSIFKSEKEERIVITTCHKHIRKFVYLSPQKMTPQTEPIDKKKSNRI